MHNLEKLIELCATKDPDFHSIQRLCAELTPYAVELRYDGDFWPDLATAEQAVEAARRIKDFVSRQLLLG